MLIADDLADKLEANRIAAESDALYKRWYNENSRTFMSRDYLLPGQTLHTRVERIATVAAEYLKDPEIAAKIIAYTQRGWFSFASPVWSNFGTLRGLPISCFGTKFSDDMDDIADGYAEIIAMTKQGGGTSGCFSSLRARGAPVKNNGSSSGPVTFMLPVESIIKTVSQGSTRRGSFAAYMDIEHPDIEEFLAIRDEKHPIQDIQFGVTISDVWMDEMLGGDYAKQVIWGKVLASRVNKGFPYIIFTDTMNDGAPQWYRGNPAYKITHSNLCTEIALPDSDRESFVCCLSSMNLTYYDEWKDTDAVQVMTMFLDAVMQEFIDRTEGKKHLQRARRFAIRHRALGLGVLGWHSLLQSKMIPFDSPEAYALNTEVFKHIETQSAIASAFLAEKFGECEVTKGHGFRNATRVAVAPTKSSSFILGQASEGIEPYPAVIYVSDVAKGKYTLRNPYFEKLLIEKGKNTPDVWDDINKRAGSVQHLDFLTEHEKKVFLTYLEIDQLAIVMHAAVRQEYIDQAQSVNLKLDPSKWTSADISRLHVAAWKQGLKSLYYQINVNSAQELSRSICESCEA